MQNCALGDKAWQRVINLVCSNVQKMDIEKKEMEKISYASTMRSLMYAQVCTCPNIAYIVEMLGKYLSNLSMVHWKETKQVMRCL